MYGLPNLVGKATTITNYSPISPDYGPDNLITHLDNRSSSWDLSPVITAWTSADTPAISASYNSCFRVDSSALTSPYVFGLDHAKEIIQNAVLLLQDLMNPGYYVGSEDPANLDKYYSSQW